MARNERPRFFLIPRSLLGQMLLGVALALLVAQAISGVLLWQAAERQSELVALNRAAFQLLAAVRDDGPGGPAATRSASWRGERSRRHEPRGIRRVVTREALPETIINAADQDKGEELRAILAREGLTLDALVVAELRRDELRAIRQAARGNSSAEARDDPERGPPRNPRPAHEDDTILVSAMRLDAGEPWMITGTRIRRDETPAFGGFVLQTLVIYLVLVGLLALLLRRVTRPLSQLTQRIKAFGQSPEVTSIVAPSGPDDIRALVRATNDMEARIATLIDEKDVMLGAIGHDLKTPLAALRVRVESVEDEAQRAKMAEVIEEMRRSLDDILTLARIGRSEEGPVRTDLSALTESVVEEFEDMAEPVRMGTIERVSADVYPTWLKRALRNLVSNAVRYGGGANVSLLQEGGNVIVGVTDNGPGIPQDQLKGVMEPFVRGEASRNRATGGAGLGLAIARAVAEQHGGTLRLSNRAGEGGAGGDGDGDAAPKEDKTGLCAELVIPQG